MPKFEIAITETRIKTVPVEAATYQEATNIITQQYFNKNIVLCDADFEEAHFDLMPSGKETYLVRFLLKETTNYKQTILYTTLDSLYDFTNTLQEREDIEDFETPILVPEVVVDILGHDIVLCPYDVALKIDPVWVDQYKYLWL